MSNPILTGAVLIEANGAALNNAGKDERISGLDNATMVKQIKIGRRSYPYISGQAWRRWWREVATEDFGWEPSPVTRQAKSAYTQGDPQSYADDDIFGYMAAKAKAKKKAPAKGKKDAENAPEGGRLFPAEETTSSLADKMEDEEAEEENLAESGDTQRRTSPLKNSLLIGIIPNAIKADQAYFSRSLPLDNPNSVPYQTEHYSTPLQGVFTLSLSDVGRFECGPMRDLDVKSVPINGDVNVQEASGNLQPRVFQMPLAVRRQRAVQTLRCLKSLRHGANLTRNLSDVTPAVVLLGFLDGGNAPLQNLFVPATGEGGESVSLHLARLESVLTDYADRFLGENTTLYFGYRPGVLANEFDVLRRLEEGIAGVNFFVGTPLQAIEAAAVVLEGVTILN